MARKIATWDEEKLISHCGSISKLKLWNPESREKRRDTITDAII
ncbi:MAG: hypothetical protein BWY66_00858 [bacterium ADurb.Bin374]|nr:MAG: hypothetical protein BWY66_00858 [bacterium ADurb.Bin374]